MEAFFNWQVLWSRPDGLRCSLIRHRVGPPYEVLLSRGAETLQHVNFESEDEAVAFVVETAALAMAEMKEGLPFDVANAALLKRS